MSRTPTPTVAVFHGDGNLTLYHPGSDGVTVHASVMGYNGALDVSLEFQSFGTRHLRPTVPLREALEYLGLPDPYSLASLEVAWEAAEEADSCRAGDVLISKSWKGADDFRVRSAKSSKALVPGLRILSRAPSEPWRDLADDLADRSALMGDLEAAARMLHEAGWRKGDES